MKGEKNNLVYIYIPYTRKNKHEIKRKYSEKTTNFYNKKNCERKKNGGLENEKKKRKNIFK
jgi:hypothetical protein